MSNLNDFLIGKRVGNYKTVKYTTATSTSSVIPIDDTIPQNTEGLEIFSESFIPKNGNSDILIILSISAQGGHVACIFKDADADAIYSSVSDGFTGASQWLNNSFTYKEASLNKTSRDYKVRIGPTSAGTTYINRNSDSASRFGATTETTMTIIELLP
tara:strand:+ start:61 stop:534 length:474 start_codon:yes stop_codon:yes gene_type:complete